MQFVERFLRWYFGVSGSTDVGRSDWGFRAHLTANTTWVLILVVVGLLIPVAGWLSWRETRRFSHGIRLFLAGLRISTMLLLIVMLLQVSLVIVHYGRPVMAVLLDTSASMTLGDNYPPRIREKLNPATPKSEGQTRLDLVRLHLLQQDGQLLKEFSDRYEVHYYTFDSDAVSLKRDRDGRADVAQVAELQTALEQIDASGTRTNLSRSVQQVLSEHRGSPPVAVVVITDGNATDSGEGALSRIARRAGEHQSPLFVVGVGSEQGVTDGAVDQVRFESVTFAGSPLVVDVVITGTHLSGQQTRVTIQAKGDDAVIDSQPIQLPRDDARIEASLRIPHLRAGRNEFEIHLEPLAGESDLANNSQTIRVWARESKLSVLLVDQQPRWEFRHLKTVLERDQNIDLNTVLLESDAAYDIEDRTALLQLPSTLDEMSRYDAVILGNLDWEQIEPGFAELLPSFVGEQGGGLLWIPGLDRGVFQHMPTSLNVLLPVEIDPADGDVPETRSPIPWKLKRTVEGRGHPLLSFVGASDAEVSWQNLPPVYVSHEDVTPKDGTLILVQGDALQRPPLSQPMLSSMRYGAGQVLLQSFDDTWRWKPLHAGRIYRQYWSQLVRFLTKQRILAQLPPWELLADREEYMADEPVRIQLVLNRPHELAQVDPELLITSAGTSRTVRMSPSEKLPNILEVTVKDLAPGRYSATLALPRSSSPLPSVEWLVSSVDRERKYRGMNYKDLQLSASRSGGQFYNLWELGRLADVLPKSHRTANRRLREIPLWNRWESILLISGLLMLEWIVRRRRGLV